MLRVTHKTVLMNYVTAAEVLSLHTTCETGSGATALQRRYYQLVLKERHFPVHWSPVFISKRVGLCFPLTESVTNTHTHTHTYTHPRIT